MNAKSQTFEFNAELCQVEEVVCSFLHTLLFHRSTGKFHYQKEGSYTVGTLGYEDVDCHFIDCSYVRCSSEKLHKTVLSYAKQFKDALKNMDSHRSGQISLEFFQKRKNPWPFPTESVPWEMWVLKLNIVSVVNDVDRVALREKLTEAVCEEIKVICEIINKPDYIPKMPNEPDLTNVFDNQYLDAQPYLHKFYIQTSEHASETSVGNTMRRLIKDTFNY